jgi:hypothetical protein
MLKQSIRIQPAASAPTTPVCYVRGLCLHRQRVASTPTSTPARATSLSIAVDLKEYPEKRGLTTVSAHQMATAADVVDSVLAKVRCKSDRSLSAQLKIKDSREHFGLCVLEGWCTLF